MTKLKGAEIIMECLRKEGVDIIFGYPGGANLPMYDALIKYPDIKHVLVRHDHVAPSLGSRMLAATTGRTAFLLLGPASGPI